MLLLPDPLGCPLPVLQKYLAWTSCRAYLFVMLGAMASQPEQVLQAGIVLLQLL